MHADRISQIAWKRIEQFLVPPLYKQPIIWLLYTNWRNQQTFAYNVRQHIRELRAPGE